MKVALRFDASHKIGLGHLYRCIALAKELEKRGHEPVFVTRIFPETAEALMSCGFDIIPLKPGAGREEDLHAITYTGADAIVIDMMPEHAEYADASYMAELKGECKLLIAIDNNGDGAMVAHRTFNTLHNKIHGDNIVEDLSYAILRDSFIEEHEKKRVLNENAREILVMQGGSDRYNVIPKIIQALEGSGWLITVVVGTTFKGVIQEKSNLKVLRDVQNMAVLMSNVDAAITGAGMSLLELMCVGTPTITISTEDFEKITAEKLENKGVTVNLGFGPEVDADAIRKTAESLKNIDKRNMMSKKGKELIDGVGAQRIVDFIENEIGGG